LFERADPCLSFYGFLNRPVCSPALLEMLWFFPLFSPKHSTMKVFSHRKVPKNFSLCLSHAGFVSACGSLPFFVFLFLNKHFSGALNGELLVAPALFFYLFLSSAGCLHQVLGGALSSFPRFDSSLRTKLTGSKCGFLYLYFFHPSRLHTVTISSFEVCFFYYSPIVPLKLTLVDDFLGF